MKILSIILFVTLIFSAFSSVKQHKNKSHHSVSKKHLTTIANNFHKMLESDGIQACNGVGFLECIQDYVHPEDNEYLAEQILNIVVNIQSLQLEYSEKPQDLQLAVVGLLSELAQDQTTGDFWQCAFGALSPTVPACQDEEYVFRNQQISLQFPFSELPVKGVKNVQQKRIHLGLNRVNKMMHKQEDFNPEELKENAKCFIVSILDAVQSLDPSENWELVEEFIHLSEEKQEFEQELQGDGETIFNELLCQENTQVFWQNLFDGILSCQGEEPVEFSEIPCDDVKDFDTDYYYTEGDDYDTEWTYEYSDNNYGDDDETYGNEDYYGEEEYDNEDDV